jgi:predicted GNAT family N-acyltransferase
MIDYKIQRLSEDNRSLIEGFSCVESDDVLANLSAKERRRVKKHSKEMDDFLYNEALEEQEKGLNTTYLFIYDSRLVAYLSLCNDAIRLDFDEKAEMELSYVTEPAIKIARLAVSNQFRGMGLGKEAIEYAILVSQQVKKLSGVVFLTLDCYKHRLSYYENFGFEKNLIQAQELSYDSPISMRLWIDEYLRKFNDEI